MQESGLGRKPLHLAADSFNGASELYYRTTLKQLQTTEGLTVLAEDCERLEKFGDPHLRQVLAGVGRDCSGAAFIRDNAATLLCETASPEILRHLLQIVLAVVHHERQAAK